MVRYKFNNVFADYRLIETTEFEEESVKTECTEHISMERTMEGFLLNCYLPEFPDYSIPAELKDPAYKKLYESSFPRPFEVSDNGYLFQFKNSSHFVNRIKTTLQDLMIADNERGNDLRYYSDTYDRVTKQIWKQEQHPFLNLFLNNGYGKKQQFFIDLNPKCDCLIEVSFGSSIDCQKKTDKFSVTGSDSRNVKRVVSSYSIVCTKEGLPDKMEFVADIKFGNKTIIHRKTLNLIESEFIDEEKDSNDYKVVNIEKDEYKITKQIESESVLPLKTKKIKLSDYVVNMLDNVLRITTESNIVEKPKDVGNIQSAKEVFFWVVSIRCHGKEYYQFVDGAIGCLSTRLLEADCDPIIDRRYVLTDHEKINKENIESISLNKFFLDKQAVSSLNFKPSAFNGRVERWKELYINNVDENTLNYFLELGVLDGSQPKTSKLRINVLGEISFELIDRDPLPEEYPSTEIGIGYKPGSLGLGDNTDREVDYDYVIYDQYMGWYRHFRINKGAKAPIMYQYEGNFRLKVQVECDNLIFYRLSLRDEILIRKGPYKKEFDIEIKIPKKLIEKLLPLHRSGGKTIEKDSMLWNKVIEVIMPNCQQEVICQIREEIKKELDILL